LFVVVISNLFCLLKDCDVQQLLSEKEMQIKALQEELKAAKFDRATKELERERENQVN